MQKIKEKRKEKRKEKGKEKIAKAAVAALMAFSLVSDGVPVKAKSKPVPKGLNEMVSGFTEMKQAFTLGPEADPKLLKGLERRLDPKLVHVSNIVDYYKWERYRDSVTGKTIKYVYKGKYRITKNQEKQAQKKINSISTSAKKIKNKEQRVRRIYRDVTKGVSYRSGRQYCYTSYGALVKKQACCQGISDAFALACSRAGIKTQIISGKSTMDGNTAHMWTRVYVNGSWMYCDPTWDIDASRPRFLMKSEGYFRKTGHKAAGSL